MEQKPKKLRRPLNPVIAMMLRWGYVEEAEAIAVQMQARWN